MALTVTPRWKEQYVVENESGKTFVLDGGWGVDPNIAYVPSAESWQESVPEWLWERRDEVIEELRKTGHAVHEGGYPKYEERR
jgi:hypothetical protein